MVSQACGPHKKLPGHNLPALLFSENAVSQNGCHAFPSERALALLRKSGRRGT